MEYNTVVVGAGPSGLLLARDLAAAGHRVAVVEKHESINPFSRAFGIMSRTLEMLEYRKILEPVLPQGTTIPFTDIVHTFTRTSRDIDTICPFMLGIPQPYFDKELEQQALSQGITLYRGCTVISLHKTNDTYTLTSVDKQGNKRAISTQVVIAADGAHSTIRTLLGKDFPGETVIESVALADVTMDSQTLSTVLPARTLPYLLRSHSGYMLILSFGHDNMYRVITWNKNNRCEKKTPVTMEEIQGEAIRCLGNELPITGIIDSSRFNSDERIIDDYQHDKVFFIGDAAHCHSPFGGQGLNTGIQDAANLSWKLSLYLQGASDEILTTYNTERRPMGLRAIRLSNSLMRWITSKHMVFKGIAFIGQTAVKLSPQMLSKTLEKITGLDIHYAHINLSGQRHRIIGTRAIATTQTGNIHHHLDGLHFAVALHPKDTSCIPWLPKDIIITQRVDNGPSILIRPDGYITAVHVRDTDKAHDIFLPELGKWGVTHN